MLTCEHATNKVPPSWRNHATTNAARLLTTHYGWDIGALKLANYLKGTPYLFGRRCGTNLNSANRIQNLPLFQGEVSRLLVDLNRSTSSTSLFSPAFSLNDSQKRQIMTEIYAPYRKNILAEVRRGIRTGSIVVHLSIHSFTPVWKGQRRETEIGILFDPRRLHEAAIARAWLSVLRREGTLTVHANRPYRGTADGLTRTLRAEFSAHHYIGIEIEVNQKFFSAKKNPAANVKAIGSLLAVSFDEALNKLNF